MTLPPPRVLVSYTGEDLSGHAAVVFDVVAGTFRWPVEHDKHWAPTGAPTLAHCVETVQASDLVILLLAWRYGSIPEGDDGETSYVEHELRAAREKGVRVIPFVVDEEESWPPRHIQQLKDPDAGARLARLKDSLKGVLRGYFGTDPDSLRAPLLEALREFEREWGRREVSGAAEVPPPRDDLATRHRRSVAENLRNLRLIGFGEQLQVRLPIADAWVPLHVRLPGGFERVDVGEFDEDRLARAGCLDDTTVEGLFVAARERDRRGVALLGEPGAGKTTAARLLAWTAADATRGPARLGLPDDVVPVFLRLRRLGAADSLRAFLRAEVADGGIQLWKRGRLLWILDGLDEVANPARRAQVSGWVRDALEQRPDDWFVVTCRYAGYRDDAVLGADFVEAHVAPLDPDQRRDFVARWYRAVEAQAGLKGVDGAAEAHRRATALGAALDGPDFRHRRMAEIAANPLLLSVLCIAHRKDAELPRRRVDVYRKATDVLLEHWPRGKELVPLDGAAARSVLAPMAWWLHGVEGRADASEAELVAVVEPHLRALADPTALGTDARAFLARLRDGSGILVSPDPGRYAFLHLSFQEYLAATWAVVAGESAALAEKLGSSWWQEVALLTLGLEGADAEGFFGRVIAGGGLESDGEVVDYAFSDTLRLPLRPFIAALSGEPARAVAVLRRLGGRTDPVLVEAVKEMRSGDPGLSGAVETFLDRAGVKRVPAPSREPRLGDTMVHERTGIVLCWIPGGEFVMGSEEHERERPPHRVRVPGFWLGKYAVTNEEYGRFVADGGRAPRYWENRAYNRPRQPVVGVTWDDAAAFCSWAGLEVPTEARWEYACRAGTTGRYSCEEGALGRHAWTERNSDGRLHPVGELAANPWGLFDMHGNVWEWCADWYAAYAPGRDGAPLADPRGPTSGPARVVRGGSWGDGPAGARSGCRIRNHPESRDQVRGFRVMLSAPA